jgi:hypothetical protein
MRAVLHVDIVTLGRVLLGTEPDKREHLCDCIFDRAHAADKYRKRFGVYHGQFGTGALASACLGLNRSVEPFLSDRDYVMCLRMIFDRILQGPNHPRAHVMQVATDGS